MKRKLLIITTYTLLLGALCALVGFATLDAKTHKVESIDITINDPLNSIFLSEARVRAHLDEFGSLIGLKIETLPLRELHEHLENIPSVKEASVHTTLSGELKITLTQRMPVVRVHPQQGPDFYIDEEGLALPLDQLKSERVPIIHARDISEAMPAVEFLKKVEGDEFWSALIDQIIVDESGKITVLPRIGAPLFLGSELEPVDQKRNLLTFYREHVKTGNLKKYNKIDLSYADQVIATKYAHLN